MARIDEQNSEFSQESLIMKKIKRIKRKNIIILLILLIFYFIWQGLTIDIDLIPHDESIVYMGFKRTLDGHQLYSETFYGYGPIAPHVYAFFMRIFGDSLLTVRWIFTFFYSLVIISGYFLCRKFMSPVWAAFGILAASFMMFQPIYNYGHVFPALGTIIAILFIIEPPRSFVLSGLATGLVLLHKPLPVGIVLYGAIILFFLFRYRGISVNWSLGFIKYNLGTLIITAPFYLYYLIVCPFDMIHNMLFFRQGAMSNYMFQFGFTNILSYIITVFQTSNFSEFYLAAKDLYYVLLVYLPILIFVSTLYLLKPGIYLHKFNAGELPSVYFIRRKPFSFVLGKYILIFLSFIAPFYMIQIYIHGGRPGREIGFLLYPAIFITVYWLSQLYYRIRKRYSIPVIAGAVLFFILPSAYLLRTDIYAHELTVGKLKGIRVSEKMYDVIEGVTDYADDFDNPTIMTWGRSVDIYNMTFKSRNIFGDNLMEIRFSMNMPDLVQSVEVIEKDILPIVSERLPQLIITGRRDIVSDGFRRLIDEHYTLGYQSGDFVGFYDRDKDFKYCFGTKVYRRK